MSSIQKQYGFSLYELVIVLGILALLSAIIPPLFINFNRLYLAQNNLATIQIKNQFAMDAIAEEARLAKGVLASRTINSTLYTTATTTIVFEYPVFDSNGDLVANETDYSAFYRDSSDLSKLNFTLETSTNSARNDLTQTLADDVDTLIFRYNTSNLASTTVITALVQSSIEQLGEKSTITQTSAFSLRNQ
jgi:prepilin-type N-terminal cleavage/methylation domain-containing protein